MATFAEEPNPTQLNLPGFEPPLTRRGVHSRRTVVAVHKAYRRPGRREPAWWIQMLLSEILLAGLLAGAFYYLSNHTEDARSSRAERLENLRHIRTSSVRKFALIDLEEMALESLDLDHADFSQAHLSGADLSYDDLTGADMGHVELRGATLRFASLSRASLVRADLRRAVATHVNFVNAELMDADLRGADLAGTTFALANLANADLRGAKNVREIDFTNTKLTDIAYDCDLRFFRKTRWPQSFVPPPPNCTRTEILVDANLIDADLTYRSLRSAKLTNARLDRAILNGVDFTGADLTGANLNGIRYDCDRSINKTIWPAGFVPPSPTCD
jgi:uncharacterized protein YjbI with pentapeptide repeats